jgi:hypothetical protein
VSGERGPGPAEVVAAARADPHQQHHPQVGVAQPLGVQHHPLRDLACLTGPGGRLQQGEEVLVELVDQLGGARAEQRSVGVGEHRDGDHLHAGHGGWSHVAQRDLRR